MSSAMMSRMFGFAGFSAAPTGAARARTAAAAIQPVRVMDVSSRRLSGTAQPRERLATVSPSGSSGIEHLTPGPQTHQAIGAAAGQQRTVAGECQRLHRAEMTFQTAAEAPRRQ